MFRNMAHRCFFTVTAYKSEFWTNNSFSTFGNNKNVILGGHNLNQLALGRGCGWSEFEDDHWIIIWKEALKRMKVEHVHTWNLSELKGNKNKLLYSFRFSCISTVYMSNKNSMELNTSQTWKVWKMMLLFVLRRCFIWTLCIIWQSTATTLPCPPAVYPHDNTWSIFAQKDITVEFVHVLTGAHGGNQWKVRIKTFQNGATKLQNQWCPGVH